MAPQIVGQGGGSKAVSGRCPWALGSLPVVSRDGRDRGQRLEHLAEGLLVMGEGPMEGLALYPFLLVLHLYCVCVCVRAHLCVYIPLSDRHPAKTIQRDNLIIWAHYWGRLKPKTVKSS